MFDNITRIFGDGRDWDQIRFAFIYKIDIYTYIKMIAKLWIILLCTMAFALIWFQVTHPFPQNLTRKKTDQSKATNQKASSKFTF